MLADKVPSRAVCVCVCVCVVYIMVASHGDSDAQNSAFLYLWIIAEVVRTCYTLTWDIKMDWGLLDKNAGENRLLREEIVYPRKVCVCLQPACSW